MRQKILVTGCAGFIGSHLVDRLLEQGHEVNGTDFSGTMQKEILHPEIPFADLDLRKENDAALDRLMEGKDTVIQNAAYAAEIMSLYRPAFVTHTNVTGALRVAEAAARAGVKRFVFVSSNSVYGYQEQCPYPEDAPKRPDDVYAIGKLATEQMVEVLSKVYGMEYTIVRPHNVYGPRQNIHDPYRNVIGIWMNRILRGKKPVVYGDGKQERAFTYIDDLADPLLQAATTSAGKNEVFNLGTDEHVTLNRAAEIVCDAMGFKEGAEHVPGRPQEVKISYPGHEKARQKLGFTPKWKFEDGVRAMAEWAKSQKVRGFDYFERVEIPQNMPVTWKEKSL